jgi:hypothetical protein
MIRHAAVWMGFAADVIADGPVHRVRDEVGVDGRTEPKERAKWRVRRLSRLSMKRSVGEEREDGVKEEEKAAWSGDRGVNAIDREKVGERGKDYSARIISSTSPSFPHFFKRPSPF